MGHIIQYIKVDRNASRSEVLAAIREEVLHEDWQEGGRYHENLTWHENKIYEDEQAAIDAIRRFDNGWYDDHAVLFRDPSGVKPTKAVANIEQRIVETRRSRADYIAAHHVRDRKSAFIGCPNCGSKVAREYIGESDRCPVCRHDLRPASTIERVGAFDKKICELEEKLTATRRKLAAKGKVRWLVKYEYHV